MIKIANIKQWGAFGAKNYSAIVTFTKGKLSFGVSMSVLAADGVEDCIIEADSIIGDSELKTLYDTWQTYYSQHNKWYAGMTFFDFAYLSGWDSEIVASFDYK